MKNDPESTIQQLTRDLAEARSRLEAYRVEEENLRKQLLESREQFELAMKGSNDGFWIWFDVTREEEWWSPQWYELLGYEEGEIKATFSGFKSLIHPDDLQEMADRVEAHFKAGQRFDMEYRLKTKDRGYRWFRGRGQAVWDDAGRPLKMAGSIQDIHDHKEAFESLKKSEQDLATAQRIAHLGDWVWNIESNDLRWSDEIFNIFGLDKDKFPATYDAFLNSIHKDDRPLVQEAVRRALEENEDYSIEHRIVLPDGSVRYVHERSQVLRSEDGKPIKMMGTVQDVTDKKLVDMELELHRNKLEDLVAVRTRELESIQEKLLHSEKLSAIGKLAASVAHEFNNPLFGIQNCMAEVLAGVNMEGEYKELLEIGLRECQRIANLIRKLQDFNKPTQMNFEEYDLHQCLDDILILFKKRLKERGIILEKHLDPSVPKLDGVPDQIKQVFLNILQNAEEAISGEGGEISLSSRNMGDKVIVKIKDTGAGISAKNLKRIFEPFFTTKSAVKGTGLGLSICYGIIKAHGGEIEVHSIPGKGTEMDVILPVDKNTKPAFIPVSEIFRSE